MGTGNMHDSVHATIIHEEDVERQAASNASQTTSQAKKTPPKIPPRAAKVPAKTPPKRPPEAPKAGANAAAVQTIPTVVAQTTAATTAAASKIAPPIPPKAIHKPLPLPPFRAKLSHMSVKDIEKLLDEKLTNIKTAIQSNKFFAPNTQKLSKEVLKDICEVYIGKDVLREKGAEVSSDLKSGLGIIALQFQPKFLAAVSDVKTKGNLAATASMEETLQWYKKLDTATLIMACKAMVPEIFDTALPLEFRKRLSDGLFMKTQELAHAELTTKGLERRADSKRASLTNAITILFESFKNIIK